MKCLYMHCTVIPKKHHLTALQATTMHSNTLPLNIPIIQKGSCGFVKILDSAFVFTLYIG